MKKVLFHIVFVLCLSVALLPQLVWATEEPISESTLEETTQETPVPDGWLQTDAGWMYYQNGVSLKDCWKEDTVGWCYLGADGYMILNDWVNYNDAWYYLGADGYMLTNTWVDNCWIGSNGIWLPDGPNTVLGSGSCGANATWTFDSSGILTISGTGDIYESHLSTPWEDHLDSIYTIMIEEGITSIGNKSFRGCKNAVKAIIPQSVTKIGDAVFADCSSLTDVTIPESVTTLGRQVFYHCKSLTEIALPDSITSIGDGAFADCSGLVNVKLPSALKTVSNTMFKNCSSLTQLPLHNGIISIGTEAFAGCTGLTTIEIPNHITNIAVGAFSSCSNVTSASIPASVTYMGGSIFSDCLNLTSIVVDDNNPSYLSDSQGILYSKDMTKLIAIPAAYSGSYVMPNTGMWYNVFGQLKK